MSEVKSCPFRKSGTYISIDDYRKKNGCLGCDLESTECCADCIVSETREADVAPVIHATNLSALAWYDKLICSHCGIVLQDWVEVRYDEDMDDTTHHEYVFNYCPNCGAKIEEAQP